MNIAGPLASLIFAVTALTVFGGVFAYGIYKARERRREEPLGEALEYFVEFTPESNPADKAELAPGLRKRRSWAAYALSAAALVGLVAAVVRDGRLGRALVLQGAWDEAATPPPSAGGAAIGAPTTLGPWKPRVASLFPSPRFDANRDGVVDAEERRALHANVPLTVVITIDDNGHTEGLAWIHQTIERYALAGRVTFFLTGNYLEGRPNHLGGPVTAWWAALARTGFVGLHGLTHEHGAGWSTQRWAEEHSGIMHAIVSRVPPPPGWSWTSYPWGSRAPYLVFDDAYFTALEDVSPRVVYDASIVVHPVAPPIVTRGTALPARDQSWPFSLDVPLPDDIELPFSQAAGRRIALRHHRIVELPVYAWAVSDARGVSSWVPPLDANLFELYPCSGEDASAEIVAAFERNLDAHYRGNRAPFHLGLHAQHYTADRTCERRTLEAMLGVVARLVGEGRSIRYEAIPRFLERLLAETSD